MDYEVWIYDNIEPDLWIDAIREAQTAKRQGRDIIAWLKYWQEQHEKPQQIEYHDPREIDNRLEVENIENMAGQRYNNYNGWHSDDI